MGDTSIEWTSGPNGEPGYTFNPWLGCSKVHAGCTHCYAEKHQAVNMRKGGAVQWGEVWQGGQRVLVADSTWKKPFQWAREAAKAGQRRKVFCASLADVLEVPELPSRWPSGWGVKERNHAISAVDFARAALDTARQRLWDTIRETAAPSLLNPIYRGFFEGNVPGLDWLLLTKRPENWRLVPEDVRPLVWLGTSIADQKTADDLVPRLLEAEGFRYRFLSAEPLVGPVDLERIPGEIGIGLHSRDVLRGLNIHHDDGDQYTVEPWTKVDWVIVGGESGPKARPCYVAWIRDVVRQCAEAEVPCFVKQLGARPVWPAGERALPCDDGHPCPPRCGALKDSKGGDWDEWPEDLRVRRFPGRLP